MIGIPYTGSGVSACIRAVRQGAGQARDARRRDPDAGLLRVQRDRVPRARRRRRRCRRSRQRLQFPIVVKPAAQGSALGIKFARTPADVPAALVAAFSYDRKVLLERYVARPRPGRLDHRRGRRAAGAADRRGGARAGGLLRLRVPLRDRSHALRLPGRARRARRRRARATIALDAYAAARLLRLRARRPDARRRAAASCTCSRLNPIPGLTETSLLPQAADAAGIGFDELIGRIARRRASRRA